MMTQPFRYLFVSALGRRETGSATPIQAELRSLLQYLESEISDAKPIAIASGAVGADQNFLSAARELGWPIKLILPAPAHSFEKDFTCKNAYGTEITDEAGLATFRELLSDAIDVEVIQSPIGRRDAYTRCANKIVNEADLLIVLWDGHPGKQGGTNESLLLAHQLSIPTVVLDAGTGRVWDNQPIPPIEILSHRFKERYESGIFKDISKSVGHSLHRGGHTQNKNDDSIRSEKLSAFLQRPLSEQRKDIGSLLSVRAQALSTRHRFWNKVAISCHVGATLVGLITLVFANVLPHIAIGVAAWVKLLVVFFALGITLILRKISPQYHWVRVRFVREINRSLTQTAPICRLTGEAVGSFVPTSIWAVFRHLRQPLQIFHGLASRDDVPTTLREVIANYRKHRLAHYAATANPHANELSQRDYHQREAEKAGHQHHFYTAAFWSVIGMLSMCVIFTVALEHSNSSYPYFKLGAVFLPVVMAAILVMPNLHDGHRRQIVSKSLQEQLSILDEEANAVEAVLASIETDESVTIAQNRPDALPVSVWQGTLDEQKAQAEAWAANRIVEIARETENALLTELIGFKTFVESVEIG